MKKFFFWVIGIMFLMLITLPFVLILIGKDKLHDSDIPQKNSLFISEQPQKILAFFPHPDDEVTVSGTLMNLLENGNEVYLVTLTKGEAGNSMGEHTKSELAQLRTLEMERSAELIGVTQLNLLNYPDSGLENLGLDSLKQIALEWIEKINPDILVSYDSKVGLYGHPDHRLSGLALEQVFLENRGKQNFSPVKLFQITLSPKQIEVALQLSSGFQRNYPRDREEGLPKPDFSVYTQPYFERVLAVMKSHETQQDVLKDLMPYHDKIPSWIYSRIFDREYFHEVK
ncbi:MAG: PIG-L family deacetylase [Algoriphagus sp.]|uniref:PIG-L deacetylase family protein n=1 Tax=Algoriphagus sp. TaxID=1872435 RepID=UPI00262F5F5C|nr:PIG-L family deacetylase [Algoriphagus sp.]MDG1277207.1 PIG-L family deacetylase [Algoriphagus sp.]